MSDLWVMQVPVMEKVLRAAVGYAFLLVAFRVLGRRELGRLTNFDLVVVLVVANVLQNAMIGDDNSLTGGLIGAATVLGLNALIAVAVYVSRAVEHAVDGAPIIIVADGRLVRSRLRRELITENEVLAAARNAGIQRLADVRLAILESTGEINVFAFDRDRETVGDGPPPPMTAAPHSQLPTRSPQPTDEPADEHEHDCDGQG
jgi:uncharacterized membrane protein YcaP (DUF421 family)